MDDYTVTEAACKWLKLAVFEARPSAYVAFKGRQPGSFAPYCVEKVPAHILVATITKVSASHCK